MLKRWENPESNILNKSNSYLQGNWQATENLSTDQTKASLLPTRCSFTTANGARLDFNSTLDNYKKSQVASQKRFKGGSPFNFVLVEFYSIVYHSNLGQCFTAWAFYWLDSKFYIVVAILMEFLFTPM